MNLSGLAVLLMFVRNRFGKTMEGDFVYVKNYSTISTIESMQVDRENCTDVCNMVPEQLLENLQRL